MKHLCRIKVSAGLPVFYLWCFILAWLSLTCLGSVNRMLRHLELQWSAEPGTKERTPLSVHVLNLQFPHLKECATGSPQVRCCRQHSVYGSSLWTCLFLLREQRRKDNWRNSTTTQILNLWTSRAKAKRCCKVISNNMSNTTHKYRRFFSLNIIYR